MKLVIFGIAACFVCSCSAQSESSVLEFEGIKIELGNNTSRTIETGDVSLAEMSFSKTFLVGSVGVLLSCSKTEVLDYEEYKLTRSLIKNLILDSRKAAFLEEPDDWIDASGKNWMRFVYQVQANGIKEYAYHLTTVGNGKTYNVILSHKSDMKPIRELLQISTIKLTNK